MTETLSNEHCCIAELAADALSIRRLDASARAAVRSHFAGLPSDDLYLRFGNLPGDCVLDGYVERMDFVESLVLGACDADGAVAGLLELRRRGAEFEVGISVLPAYRGCGVGDRLLALALEHAGKQGGSVIVHCLATNQAMMDLARHHGARFECCGSDAKGVIELRRVAEAAPILALAS
jgi:GNAT superfamily N-acetyltransferase